MGNISLYWNTAKYLKPAQVWSRIGRRLRIGCTLGVRASCNRRHGAAVVLPQLDFDPAFLQRFPADALMEDRIIFMHEEERFAWKAPWRFDNRTPLWNYNLHYFEFLFPLVNAWKNGGEEGYLIKIQQMIRGWIAGNPRKCGGCGWDPYPVSLRLVNWLSCYGYIAPAVDDAFAQELLSSLEEQYLHLAKNLEKHLLGNHYFENLKALVIGSLFFGDETTLAVALKELKVQCAEQILPDGMHFELSPMYHNLMLEAMLRVTAALRQAGRADRELESYLQPMVDAAYSLEEGLERLPLFNDCGDNVSKSPEALLLAAKELFGIEPQGKTKLVSSGYYTFKTGEWKLIVDAGQPGPDYTPGHAHCDAMSFELYKSGHPVLVNCGTYAYQCDQRLFYKNTAAHNTVMRKGVEQSQCWGSFRMAKRASVKVSGVDDASITMVMTDWTGHEIVRRLELTPQKLSVCDSAPGSTLVSFLHFADCRMPVDTVRHNGAQITTAEECIYAPEYGMQLPVRTVTMESENQLQYHVELLG